MPLDAPRLALHCFAMRVRPRADLFVFLLGCVLLATAELRAQAPATIPRTKPPAPRQLSPLQRPTTAEVDVIILRDRSRRPGKLEICGISACLIARTVVPRPQAEWIGLNLRQQVEVAPPAPRDPAKDEVFLADGSVHAGTLLSVLAANVATVTGSYPRAQVRWVHLVQPGKDPSGCRKVKPDPDWPDAP